MYVTALLWYAKIALLLVFNVVLVQLAHLDLVIVLALV